VTLRLCKTAVNIRVKSGINYVWSFCWFLASENSSQIVFAPSNDDCSAQNWPRELKLVLVEQPGNEDTKYVFIIFLACHGNAKHYLPQRGGGVLWDKLAYSDPYMGYTLGLFNTSPP
jgi:hypothetical protein